MTTFAVPYCSHSSLLHVLCVNWTNKLEDFEVSGEEEQNANDKTGEVVEMEVCSGVSLPVCENQCQLHRKHLSNPFLPLLVECREWRWRILSRLSAVQINYRPISDNEEK